MKGNFINNINYLDVADALTPRCELSPSQENLQDQKIQIGDAPQTLDQRAVGYDIPKSVEDRGPGV